MPEGDEVQCDFCGEWIEQELAKDAGWIFNFFIDAMHTTSVGAAACSVCKKSFLEQGDDNEYHCRED